MAGDQVPRLPEEIWQRIAARMTVEQWATSGALCCKMFSRLQLSTLNLHIPRARWTTQQNEKEIQLTRFPGGAALHSLQWACAHWKAATDLKVYVHSLCRKADEGTVDYEVLTDRNVPKHVKKLHLLSSSFYHHDEHLYDPGLFEWLLSKVSTVEEVVVNTMGSTLPSLDHMTALNRLTLVGCDSSDLYGVQLPSESLELLEIFGKPAFVERDELYSGTPGLDLSMLTRLKWLGLSYILPNTLDLPSWCRVSVQLDTCAFAAEHFSRAWRGNGRLVYNLHCFDQQHGGINDCSFLQFFPNLEQLNVQATWDNDWEYLAEHLVVPVPVNLSLAPRLSSLTRLRISYIDIKPLYFLEVTIPGHLPLEILILMAQRLHLRLESPQRTASRLEEMIVGSFEPGPQVSGADLFQLMDALGGRGIAVGTAVDRGDEFAYSSKKMCLYMRKQGEAPKSYKEIVDSLRECYCGKCTDCLQKERS